MGWAGLLPLVGVVLVGVVGLLRVYAMRASSLVIDADGVAIRNWPRSVRRVPLSAVDRFDQEARDRGWNQVRRVSAVLLLKDGSELPVRSLGDPEDHHGLAALNNRLNAVRATTP